MADRKVEWRGAEWTGLLWVAPMPDADPDWRGLVGYDGYRRSFLAAIYYEDDDGSTSLTWAVGNDVGDEIPEFTDFVRRCDSWQEFPFPGAVDWSSHPDLQETLKMAPAQARHLQLHQKWYQHYAGDLEIWTRVWELHEISSDDWISEEVDLYAKGYVLGSHFSVRTAPGRELAHLVRQRLVERTPIPEYIARGAVEALGIADDATTPP